MKAKFFLFIIAICFASGIRAADYTGDNILLILDTHTSLNKFQQFKDFWHLNQNYENPAAGIIVHINNVTGHVSHVFIAGENMAMNGAKFSKYSSLLPYGITFDDDSITLKKKLGAIKKRIGANTLLFYKDDIVIEASYSPVKQKSISYLRLYKDEGRTFTISTQKVQEGSKPTASKEQVGYAVSAPLPPKKITAEEEIAALKRSIKAVFKSWKETALVSIKDSPKNESNFWDYKYTYNTKLKIPGEQYNLVYSYPFITSQLDFVSVINDADTYSASFDTTYHEFEKKLMAAFPASEGWTASCLPNRNNAKLSAFEVRHDWYGVMILDYTQNPKGRHVLYLRFLLYSN